MARNTGMPLPLPYQINVAGKHTEKVINTDSDIVESKVNKLNTVKKIPLAAIGTPLPLNYLRKVWNEDDPENKVDVISSDVDNAENNNNNYIDNNKSSNDNNNELERPEKHHIRLSDLGDPLPLKYNFKLQKEYKEEEEDKEKEKEDNKEKEQDLKEIEEIKPIVHTVQDNRILMKKYDFGTPLPLDYVNKEIKTNPIVNNSKFRFKSTSNNEYCDESYNDISQNDISQIKNERILVENKSIKLDSNNTNNEFNENLLLRPYINDTELEDIMNQEIQEYIQTNNYKALVDKVDNAEFRLKLIRYMRVLKRQCELLNKVLQTENDDATQMKQDAACSTITVSSTTTSTTASPKNLFIEWRAYIQSAVVSTGVFVLLCAVSYFLAD